MFKRLLVFLCVLCMCTNGMASETGRIYDNADLFTPEEESFLADQISKFQMSTAMDFVLLTSIEELQDGSQQQKADDFYDEGGFGMGRSSSGILYLIDMYNRIPYISTCGEMILYMTDSRLNAAHEVAYDSLKSGNYALAVVQLMAAVKAFVYSGIPIGQYTYSAE